MYSRNRFALLPVVFVLLIAITACGTKVLQSERNNAYTNTIHSILVTWNPVMRVGDDKSFEEQFISNLVKCKTTVAFVRAPQIDITNKIVRPTKGNFDAVLFINEVSFANVTYGHENPLNVDNIGAIDVVLTLLDKSTNENIWSAKVVFNPGPMLSKSLGSVGSPGATWADDIAKIMMADGVLLNCKI
jgi:hypothetical protein